MKKSIVIKEVNAEETERIFCSSVKLALEKVKEQKKLLSDEEKKSTKFRIIEKI